MTKPINKADQILESVTKSELKKSQAKLRIFFGMSAGVGKTYAMLKAAHQAKNEGKDIVVGVAEAHGRTETLQLFQGLEFIPLKKIHYRDKDFEELDIDAILARKPEIVVIDELAHTNIPGSRHSKRYQDLLEILDAGINVYTAVNVQHIESRKDSIEKITGITVQETVPDSIIERADLIELIDITPSELLKRLREGKVYLGDKAVNAQANFFKEAPLSALRETSLRLVAERVDRDVQDMTQMGEIKGPLNTNERLMVAVSHSPYSEKLIRAARRLAYNLEAPWMAVNIDTGLKLSDKDELQRSKNIDLAIELGAQVVTIVDTNLAHALNAIARQYNATQLIIGRPTRRSIKDLFRGGSLSDQLIKEASDIDIHIIRHEGEYKPVSEKLWTGFHSPAVHYYYSFAFVLILALISFFINDLIGYDAVGFIFLLGVLIISLIFNIGPILFTASISALVWDLMFIPPFGTFYILELKDMMMCLAYFLTAAITGILTSRIRTQQRVLKERGEKSQLLYEVSRCLASQSNLDEALTIVLQKLERSFKGKFFIIKGDDSLDINSIVRSNQADSTLINDHELGVAKWVYEKQKPAGWSTDTLPASKGLYIPLKTSQSSVGVLAYMPEANILSHEQADLLYTIARELALVLERNLFEKNSKELEKLEAFEKLHQALLSSISHELKTPLTTIIGTASTIADLQAGSDPGLMKSLLDELLDSAEKLKYIVENLLDMTRIKSQKLVLKQEWYDIRDIINSIIHKNKRLLKNFQIECEIQDDLPLVFIDYRLFEQALANIILNAANYSLPNTQITIRITTNVNNLIIVVNDQGAGIVIEERVKIFNKFYRIAGSINSGTGLGLYITKEILDLHKASIQVETGENNIGTKFIICLPLTDGK